jgi:NAD-dependent dihydropyrimidine dehydrogenase PreA subunit
MDASDLIVIKQHLIDPEICIRCNTCEATCPVGAISHDSRNYVVDAEKCNLCMACVPPCPTGSIDNWRIRCTSSSHGTCCPSPCRQSLAKPPPPFARSLSKCPRGPSP